MPLPRRKPNVRMRPLASRAREEAVAAARRARREAVVLGPAFAGVLLAYDHRRALFGPSMDQPVQIATVIALAVLGWALARDLGRAIGPQLLGRLDPGTAGTIGFLIRLGGAGIALLVSLRIAGLSPRTLAVGGAFTAVIVGLAAQQTFGNLFAGMVLLSARPFRVGDRIRLQGGALAGELEGVVASLGLLYVAVAKGGDIVLVPNSVVLSVSVSPLRDPDGVDFVARLPRGVKVSEVQTRLEETINVATRQAPHVDLVETDDDEIVVRVEAVPVEADEGWRLADQVLAAVDVLGGDDVTAEHEIAGGVGAQRP